MKRALAHSAAIDENDAEKKIGRNGRVAIEDGGIERVRVR